MKDRKYRFLFCICLLIMMTMVSLYARDINWSWSSCADDRFIAYRYQLGARLPDDWSEVSSDITEVHLPETEDRVMYIQATEDGHVWTDLAIGHYSPSETTANYLGARLSLSPYSISIFDFYNGHSVPDARYLTYTDYGASVDAELFWQPMSHFAINLDAAYTLGFKEYTVLPDGSLIHMARIGVGMDLVFDVGNTSIFIGAKAGELYSVNGRYWNPAFVMGARALLEYRITDAIAIGLHSSAALSFQDGSELRNRSITWIIEPLALSFTYRF